MHARKLIKNFLLLLSGNILGQLFFFVGFVHLARVLGPFGFGQWNFAQGILMFFHRAGEFGLEVVGVRETACRPEETSNWMTKVVALRLIFACALFGLGFLLVQLQLVPNIYGNILLLFLTSMFPMAFLLEWVYEGRQQLMQISIARIAKGLIFFLLVIITVKTSSDVTQSSIIYVVSLTIPILYIFFLAWKKIGFGPIPSNVNLIVVLREAFPIGIATLLSQYSLFIGTIIIGYFLTTKDVGYYAAGQRIVIFLWAYLVSSMHRVLLPSLARSYQNKTEEFSSFVISFFRRSAIGSFYLGITATAIAPVVFNLLYSTQYAPSIEVFQYMIWAFVIAAVRCIFEIGLIASNNQRLYLYGMIVVSILYTILIPILTFKYGIIGAAFGSVIAEFGYLIFVFLVFPFLTFSFLLSVLWRPTLGLVIGIAALLIFSTDGWWLQFIISTGAYFLVLFIVKAISFEDIKWIFNFIFTKQNEVTV